MGVGYRLSFWTGQPQDSVPEKMSLSEALEHMQDQAVQLLEGTRAPG